MIGLSRMPILYPLSPKLWTRLKELNSLPNSMSDEDTTMFGSERRSMESHLQDKLRIIQTNCNVLQNV